MLHRPKDQPVLTHKQHMHWIVQLSISSQPVVNQLLLIFSASTLNTIRLHLTLDTHNNILWNRCTLEHNTISNSLYFGNGPNHPHSRHIVALSPTPLGGKQIHNQYRQEWLFMYTRESPRGFALKWHLGKWNSWHLVMWYQFIMIKWNSWHSVMWHQFLYHDKMKQLALSHVASVPLSW